MTDKTDIDNDSRVPGDQVTVLPDGSAVAIGSFPLPDNHWLTREGASVAPMPLRMGAGHFVLIRTYEEREAKHSRLFHYLSRSALEKMIAQAARFAIRGATMKGAENDFDPDALVQNMIVGMLGPSTETGLYEEAWENPGPEGDAARKKLAEEHDDPNWIAASLEYSEK